MPSDVFKRSMFQASNAPMKADSGITQGFEDDEELAEDEMMEELGQRKPNSPEILMNNLRGDMRSVDARYQELADMVGEEAAMDTPPEVLALLQSQIAQQQPMGIGALPPGQGMSPPPAMPAGAPMPTPEMGGMPQEPQGFALGGFVTPAMIQAMSGPLSGSSLPTQQAPVMLPSGEENAEQFMARRRNRLTSPQGIAALMSGQNKYAEGGEVFYPPAEGVYSNFSNGVAAAGRNGDTMLAHITPEQEAYLTMLGDGRTTNPETGLPEHYMGMSGLYNMGANLASRAMPYVQAADAYAGRALFNPVLTAPTLSQSRTTLGTFGPKVVDGLEMVYPTLSQRVGQVAGPIAERVAQTPAWAKLTGAAMAIPGASYIANKFDNPTYVAGNLNAPKVPGDPATGWVPPEDEEAPKSTPINWNNLPPSTGVQKAGEPPAAPTTEQFIEGALKKPAKEGRLEAYMQENLPIFEKYLGGDKNYNQAQALFILADMGLKLAQPRKKGESFASTLARSASGVPAGLSAIAAQEEQGKRSVRGAALTSGLQQIAAEDKATAALQKTLLEKMAKSGELKPENLGAGLTSYTTGQGQPAGMRVEETVTKSFLDSRFTPQVQKDSEGQVVGFDTPYARVGPNTQTINLDRTTRERLAGEVSRQELALSKIDDAIKYYTDAFGPKAFFSNLKNNVLVPVSPIDPNTLTEEQRTKIMTALNTATKAIARAGDTGNIAVAEQNAAKAILGDNPGAFFSDYQTALKRIMTVRTDLANQRLNTAAQLGWINQDVQLDVPNIGTPADPIPQDKLGYLKSLKTVNPNGQVYVNIGGKATPVLLSTLKD